LPERSGISPGTFSRSTWTPGQARGDGIGAGHSPRLRHSGLDLSLPRSAVRPFSVIPAKAEPAPDSIRGIHVHLNETAEGLPERTGISPATFSRSTWTPGQARGDGIGAGHSPRLRHPGLDLSLPRSALRPFSVIPAKAEPAPDSIRGIHVHRNETAEGLPERTGISPATFSRSKWTPGQGPG
jgi:hypothetical protein